MRRLILAMSVSLDGLVSFGPADFGLPPEDPALVARKLDLMDGVGAHLMGRKTYDEMAGFWPTSDHPYAKPMNDIPKVVFSRTLTEAGWPESTIAGGDLAEEVDALKRAPGKDLLAWGGITFAQSLNRLGLVDEYRLIYQPVAIGQGHSPFAGLPEPLLLDLIEATAYGDGSVLQIHRRAARP
jgi:dihydrofolate reductase